MCKIIITDNFSPSMLADIDIVELGVSVEFVIMPTKNVCSLVHRDDVEVISAIRNVDVARTISNTLGIELSTSEIPIKLKYGDSIIVFEGQNTEYLVYWRVSFQPCE